MTKHNHIKDREKKFSPYIMDPNVSSALVKKGLRSRVMVHKLGAASNSQQWQGDKRTYCYYQKHMDYLVT
jgi:hypothetical protein